MRRRWRSYDSAPELLIQDVKTPSKQVNGRSTFCPVSRELVPERFPLQLIFSLGNWALSSLSALDVR